MTQSLVCCEWWLCWCKDRHSPTCYVRVFASLVSGEKHRGVIVVIIIITTALPRHYAAPKQSQVKQARALCTTTAGQTPYTFPLSPPCHRPCPAAAKQIVPTGTKEATRSSSMSSLTGRQQANPQQAASVPKQNPMSTMGRIKIRLNRARNLKVRVGVGVGGGGGRRGDGRKPKARRRGSGFDGVISAVGYEEQARA
jgi:hypothetical protein